jgi:hypothetical protein
MPLIIFGGLVAALLMFRWARTLFCLLLLAGMVDFALIAGGLR